MNQDQQPIENQNAAPPEEEFLTYEEILEEYRRRQMIEHLTGPVISLVLHVVVISLFAFFLAGREIVATTTEIEFDIQELEYDPIDPEILDRLDELDPDIVRDPVPTIEPPDIQPDAVDSDAVDDFADDMAATEFDMDFATDLDVRPARSPLVLPGVMASRGEEGRAEALRRHAGRWARQTEAAVIRALEWLKNNQNPNGSWTGASGSAAAMTGLGVLTFLAHNEIPAHSERYGDTVRRGIQFLVDNHHQSGGNPYANGIVAYALSEAYAMTRMPAVKPAMNEAVRRIVEGQQEETGGWDYHYRLYSDKNRWDLSVSAWQIQALKAAHMAGAEVEGLEEAMERAVDFLKNRTFHSEHGFAYSSLARHRPAAVQGGGTLGLQLLGELRSSEEQTGIEIINRYRTDGNISWDNKRLAYIAYYQTQAVFHAGARHFRAWNNVLAPLLIQNQSPDGSWRIPGADDWEGCPVMNTTLHAMSLMVYYRFLPTFQDPEQREETVDVFAFDEDELSLNEPD